MELVQNCVQFQALVSVMLDLQVLPHNTENNYLGILFV
jgi:hypothetical protein